MAEILIDLDKVNDFMASKEKASNEIQKIKTKLIDTNTYKKTTKASPCDIEKLQHMPLGIIIEEIHELNFKMASKIKNNTLENKLKIAMLNIAAAEIEITSNNLTEAWAMISRAHYVAGVFIGIEEANLIESKKSEKIEIARNAGIAKGLKKELAKQKIMELLDQKKPAKGWKSHSEAAKAVLEEYLNFLKQNRHLGLAESNAENYIKKVIREKNILKDEINN